MRLRQLGSMLHLWQPLFNLMTLLLARVYAVRFVTCQHSGSKIFLLAPSKLCHVRVKSNRVTEWKIYGWTGSSRKTENRCLQTQIQKQVVVTHTHSASHHHSTQWNKRTQPLWQNSALQKAWGKLIKKFLSSNCRGTPLPSSNHNIFHIFFQTEITALPLNVVAPRLHRVCVSVHTVIRRQWHREQLHRSCRDCWTKHHDTDVSCVLMSVSDGHVLLFVCVSALKFLPALSHSSLEAGESSIVVWEARGCIAHRLALQGLWRDGLRRDAGGDGSAGSWKAVLSGEEMTKDWIWEKTRFIFTHVSSGDSFSLITFKWLKALTPNLLSAVAWDDIIYSLTDVTHYLTYLFTQTYKKGLLTIKNIKSDLTLAFT